MQINAKCSNKSTGSLVSVIVPCYEQAKYLPEAIESVVNQTYTNWECIIVNDGSTDNTIQVAESLIEKYNDKQLIIINQANTGLPGARNCGIKASKGKYILPLDADDGLYPEMLEKCTLALELHPEIAVVFSELKEFGCGDKIHTAGEFTLERLRLENQLSYCSIYRREIWDATGGYNPNMIWGYEDWDFWISCSEKGYRGLKIPEPLVMYRVKEHSMYTEALESHHEKLLCQIVLNHPTLYNQKEVLAAQKIMAQYSKDKPSQKKSGGTSLPITLRQGHNVSQQKTTVFILSVGDITFKNCRKAIEDQTYKNFKTNIVSNFHPFNIAAQEMIRRCDTEYFIQVDEDMILQPDAVQKMENIMDIAPDDVGMICFYLYDIDREQNIQGVKIYRTQHVKNLEFRNRKASEMDLLGQMGRKGIKWIAHPDIVGLHGTQYTPESIYLRYKTLYEKDIRTWNIMTWDLYKKAVKFRKTGDPLQLFAILGAAHGIINAHHIDDTEKDFQKYNLESIEMFKRLLLETPSYTIPYKHECKPEPLSNEPIPIYKVAWKSNTNTSFAQREKLSHKDKAAMDILHTVEFYAPHTGGAELVVQQISERLVRRGHRVTVATTKLENRNFRELNGVQVMEFSIRGSLGNGISGNDVQRYRDFLVSHPASVMMNYAAQQWATDLAFGVIEATRSRRVNVIAPCGYSALTDIHTIRWPQFADYFNRIIPVMVPQYDTAIYHSTLCRDYEYAQNHLFLNSIVIPNGVDEEEFIRLPSVNFREKYTIKTPFLGLCVANYYMDKGQDRVIECVRQMNRDDFTMVFIGKEGDQLANLKAQAGNLNIRFCVDIPREDTLAAYQESDIFLFGSYIEASPLVIIEAKASKTPFVSTDCGNVREWKGGIVCAPEDMATHANRILNDEGLRKRLADDGWREWKENLTWESVVDRYEGLYLRLVAAKQANSSCVVQTQHPQGYLATGQTPENRVKPIAEDISLELFTRAEDLFQKGKYPDAIVNYKKAIDINSSFFDAYFGLSLAYTHLDQLDDAIANLNKAAGLQTGDASVYNNLGVLYFKKMRYDDAKLYFEKALSIDIHYEEAQQNLEKVSKVLKGGPQRAVTEANSLIGLIFSKDRAMQLDGTLRSFYAHCRDIHRIHLKVIYKASHSFHEKLYRKLIQDYRDVEFIQERGFKEQLLVAIRGYTDVLFLVDDNIFVRDFHLADIIECLEENQTALGFSMRLGKNTEHCYPLNTKQNLPVFSSTNKGCLKYEWIKAEYDFGYPLEVSSSVYRVKDMMPFLEYLDFNNPNTLESRMAAHKHLFAKTAPSLLCPEFSLTFCIPVNKVQNVCNNRAGNETGYSSDALAKKYEEGYRIDVAHYVGFVPNACHQEIPMEFKKAETKLPTVSIVIPCYNQAHFLSEAVESVVSQTFTGWECIIVNDGSSDSTAQVVESLSRKYLDSQIQLVNQVNQGLSCARNTGIKASRGKYILPLDADDLIHPAMLQKTVSLLESNPEVAIAYTDVRHFGSVDRIVCAGEYDFKRLCIENHLNYCSLYRREAWENTGGYNPNMTWGYEDWDFWLSCGEKGYYGKRIPEPLFKYRVKESSMYTKALEHHSELMAQIILNHPNLYSREQVLGAKNIFGRPPHASIQTEPLVSVVVPVYNRPDTLKRALESLAAQTYKCIEAIVVNDAGEDVSGVVNTFRDKMSIKYLVHDTNKGLAAARNTAIRHASGQYIAYLDDDDIFYPEHIETALTVLTDTNYKVVYTDAFRAHQVKIGATYQIVKKDIPYSIDYVKGIFYKTNITPVLCIVHSKTCLDEAGIFDESLSVLEDWDLWIRMAEKYDFYHIKKVTCEFSWRVDGTTTTSSKQDEFTSVREIIYKKYLKQFQEAFMQTPNVSRKLVSIVILTWNVLDYTQKCVHSIQYHTGYPHEIIFVDNASTDGTVEYLRNQVKEHSNYKLIENKENRGFAAGNNQGVAAASGEYVILLNNDVLVSAGWLESLVESLEKDEKIGMVGPITNSISGRQMVNSIPYTDDAGFHEFSQKIRKACYGRLTPRYRIAGFAALMKKTLYEEVGGLDESFGTGNYEDDDLCLKIRDKGYAIMVDESVFIHHYRSQTFIENKIDYRSSLSVNESKFMKKWPNVDYKSLLELDKSLVDINADLISQGQKAIESEKTDEALNVYSKVLRTNPIDEAALCGIGLAYQMVGKTDSAIEAYKKVIKKCIYFSRQPPSGGNSYLLDAYHNLALVYADTNKIDDAIFMLKKAVELNNSDASLHNNLGVLYFKKKMFTDATKCFSDALSIDAHYGEAKKNLEKVLRG